LFEPDFDPYGDLLEAQDMINQVIVAHNKHDELLLEFSKQHEQFVGLLKKTNRQIAKLEFEIRKLKNETE